MSEIEQRIRVHTGDITKLAVDAIVNAANSSLLGGGGVDGAIHRAAGPELLLECRTLNGCKAGDAKLTKGYRLPARYVIHTVGPVWQGGDKGEAELLASCYRRSLELAAAKDCRTVAFPAISTGVYRYPRDEAARIAVGTVSAFIGQNALPETVIFCCFDQETAELYRQAVAVLGGA
jgi:O-acetyl-ADP-ribose deacetylase (regulator of RNase III)